MAELAIAAPPAPPRRYDGLWIAPPLVVLAALFFYPLSLILRQALGGDGEVLSFAHFAEVLGSRLFHDALYHTIVIAICSTAGCLVLGFVFSVLIAFTPFPGSRVLAQIGRAHV